MFTHLHVHSHYSLLDGLPKIDELIEKAKKEKMAALALTDHGVMYGVIEFYKKAKANNIKPIIGSEVYLAPNSLREKRPKIDDKPFHLVLLVKNIEGYKNLIKLVTIAHLMGFYYKPRIDKKTLCQYSRGLIALTACLQGEIPRAIMAGQNEKAQSLIREYQKIFGDDFYLEVQDHPDLAAQAVVNKKLYEFSEKFGVPLIATNDIHYLSRDDAETQDILLCLQTKKMKSDRQRLCMLDDDFSFRSQEQMEKSFSRWPEALSNTQKIVEECNLELELGRIKLPPFPTPENLTPDEYLEKLCWERFPQYFPKKDKEAVERLNYELAVIKKTGFATYFLITQDFVQEARKNNILIGPGRGSAAGSLVSYALGITTINPLKYDLVFERFINPDRISPPDIDLDFADNRRDEVVRYIENKYGRDHVAQIITFGTMGARAAVRDVGRVLGYPYNFCDKLAKMIPATLDLKTALTQVTELRIFYETNKDVKAIIDNAEKLEGVVRHASRHACGLVITPEPLTDYLPIQYDVSGLEKTIITQYEMHSIEDLGLLKIDILGLKNLTIIEQAIKLIKQTKSISIEIDKISFDDKKTLALLRSGETTGVFQLESEGMRKRLKELKPTNLEDIIAMVALYRPGPMELIPEYIVNKHKKKRPKYLHNKLNPILEKTYGVAVYQEQLLEIARDLAGFTLSEADVLRKAVGKKIPHLLQEQKEKFIKGCEKNKIPKEIAEKIFSFIEPFAGYGFNKSHATCYATIAYQTAYLKANYPAEFMAALLSSDQGDVDRIAIEVEECERLGIEVLSPDINESDQSFTVITKNLSDEPLPGIKIRFGLLAIKNVGENIVATILQERKNNGVFQGIEDFLTRVNSKDLNKKSLESLIKAGAFDNLAERGKLLGNLETLLDFARQSHKAKKNGQVTLFGSQKFSLHLQDKPPATVEQRLFWEKELLGLFISGHPMETFSSPGKFITPINKILPHSSSVIINGIITKIKKINTANHETMLFVRIEDTTGNIEAIVFPNLFTTNPQIWQAKNVVFITGRPTDKEGVLKIIAESVQEIKSRH